MTDTLVSLGNLQRYAGRVKTAIDGKLSTTGGVMTGGIAFGGTAQLTGSVSNDLKWNEKEVERINTSGSGYIRYENGIQICWGTYSEGLVYMTSIGFWVHDATGSITFPVPFVSAPSVSLLRGDGTDSYNYGILGGRTSTTGVSEFGAFAGTWVGESTQINFAVNYIAIGYWRS